MKISIKDFSNKCDEIRSFPTDLVIFTGEIFNRKLYFLCSGYVHIKIIQEVV